MNFSKRSLKRNALVSEKSTSLISFKFQDEIYTRNNLPNPSDKDLRWTIKKKSLIILALRSQMITLEEVISIYQIAKYDIELWEKNYNQGGPSKMRITRIQQVNNHRSIE